jgi:ureidoglycolate lyase
MSTPRGLPIMLRTITAVPLTPEAFAPFGEVIQVGDREPRRINGGRAMRYHALARPEVAGPDGHVLISTVRGTPYEFTLALTMVERHPLGSQAFVPMQPRPFLVVVCHDEGGRPGRPHAFLAGPGQGINYPRNRWHGVLTPIGEAQDFLIVDRGGEGVNLEEHFFDEPWEIHLP